MEGKIWLDTGFDEDAGGGESIVEPWGGLSPEVTAVAEEAVAGGMTDGLPEFLCSTSFLLNERIS